MGAFYRVPDLLRLFQLHVAYTFPASEKFSDPDVWKVSDILSNGSTAHLYVLRWAQQGAPEGFTIDELVLGWK